jgi:ABC-type sugar transport system ATPase subunit
MLLNLFLGDQLVKVRVPEFEPRSEGDEVRVAFEPEAIHLFDSNTGLRIPK